MACCSSSEVNRLFNPQAPEYLKPFDPVRAGNCATCNGFGNINDTGPIADNVPIINTVNIIVSRLTRK